MNLFLFIPLTLINTSLLIASASLLLFRRVKDHPSPEEPGPGVPPKPVCEDTFEDVTWTQFLRKFKRSRHKKKVNNWKRKHVRSVDPWYHIVGAPFLYIFCGGLGYAFTLGLLSNGFDTELLLPDLTVLLLFLAIIIWTTHKVMIFIELFRARIDSGPPYFRLAGKDIMPFDQRVTVIFAAWIVMCLLTSMLVTLKLSPMAGWFPDGLLWSWVSNAAFFTIVGLAVAIAGLTMPHQEVFDSRVQILFGGDTSEAMKATRDKIRALGFYVSSWDTEVRVTDYDAKHNAYRVDVDSRTVLKNLFGDVFAEDEIGFGFVPDDFGSSGPNPLGEYISLNVSTDSPDKARITDRMEIKAYPVGYNQKQYFSVGKDDVIVSGRFWAWIQIGQDYCYRPKRFTDHASVTVTNTLKDSETLKVALMGQPGCDKPEDLRELQYGQDAIHEGQRQLQENSLIPFFKLLDPSTEIASDESTASDLVAPRKTKGVAKRSLRKRSRPKKSASTAGTKTQNGG